MFSLLIQSTKKSTRGFCCIECLRDFQAYSIISVSKKHWRELRLPLIWTEKKMLKYAVFFFWESKLQLSFIYFSCIQKGWNLQDFRVARLLKNWCKFFDLGFSIALTTPQTLIPILKPSEGPSSKTAQFTFGLIMEELQIMKGRICHRAASLRVG